MKKITIAFDVDGTLIRNEDAQPSVPVANERIRSLLIALASFKNVRIVVWSGGGELYARQVAASIGITQYVNEYAGKNHIKTTEYPGGKVTHEFNPDLKPDIAIDDIHECDLGRINLIVREK